MTEAWITNGDAYALLADQAEVDVWTDTGWTPTEAPGATDWVHMWHAGVTQPGLVPVLSLRNLWGPRGWVAGPPPGGANPTNPKPAAPTKAKPVKENSDG